MSRSFTKSPWVSRFRLLALGLALLGLSACEDSSKVVEPLNQYGGETVEYENPPRSRLALRRVFYDAKRTVRQEERYPLPDAARNLGFNYQKVLFDENRQLFEDLRVCPEEIDNLHDFARFHRFYDPGMKINRAEIEFKVHKAKAQGYRYSTVFYGPGAKPERFKYYDENHQEIPQP